RDGRSGLGPPPFPLPFPTLCGAIPDEWLAPLPPELAAYESRAMRLAQLGIHEIESAARAAIARYGADRVALVVGTSNAWVRPSNEALALAGLPGYTHTVNETPHSHFQLAAALGELLGTRGPAMVVSNACIAGGRA